MGERAGGMEKGAVTVVIYDGCLGPRAPVVLLYDILPCERVIGAQFERGRYPRMRFSPSVGGTQ